jgi:hypothetical protein
MARTYGSYMIQPTKDQIRHWLSEARSDLKEERSRRRRAEYQLSVANRVVGQFVLEGKITIPMERLGELALQIAVEEEAEHERQRLLENVPADD